MRSIKHRPITLAAAMLVAVFASATALAAPGAKDSAKEAQTQKGAAGTTGATGAPPEAATIETITHKQRLLVLAELNKKLRDANAVVSHAGNANAPAWSGAPYPGAPLPLPAPALTPLPPLTKAAKAVTAPTTIANAAPAALAPLSVRSIAGMGGNLSAVLSNGNSVKAGSTYVQGGRTWTVDRVTAQAVMAKACDATGRCENASLAVQN